MVDSKENYKFDLGVKGLSNCESKFGVLVKRKQYNLAWQGEKRIRLYHQNLRTHTYGNLIHTRYYFVLFL